VTVVPITQENNILFIREYLTGADQYMLGLCKGGIEEGEKPEETAQKELQEEVGYKAGRMDSFGPFFMHPAYSTAQTHIFLARDLKESKLEGDEMEDLEVVSYPFEDFEKLIEQGELRDTRVIAALYLVKRFLEREEL
jgi:ADP-ribose diphosphatase